MGDALRVGLVGTGQISGAYLRTLPQLPGLVLTKVADLDADRARATAAQAPGTVPVTPYELFAADDVDLVLNLTTRRPRAGGSRRDRRGQARVRREALAADTTQARAVLTAAAGAGVRVGCAPDTVLGTGIQTARASLDAGEIGRPVRPPRFMTTPGHERWHPAPEFYYRPGGGPLLDMGPYYLTALVHPARPDPPGDRHVGRAARHPRHRHRPARRNALRRRGRHPRGRRTRTRRRRSVHPDDELRRLARRSAPDRDLRDRSSFSVPDPNGFEGTVRISRAEEPGWTELPESGGYPGAARGYGVATWRAPSPTARPTGPTRPGFHVLDVMESLLASARPGAPSTWRAPARVPRRCRRAPARQR